MMTQDRAKQIINCYGGHDEQWPVDERISLLNLLHSNPELLKAQQQALHLDEKLEQLFASFNTIETEQLEQKILLNLPNRATASQTQTVAKKIFSKFSEINNLLNNRVNPAAALGAVVLVLLVSISLLPFSENHQDPIQMSSSMEDELLLMAEALDDSHELELFAMQEPELFEDDMYTL